MSREAFASDDAFRRVCDLVGRVGSCPDGPRLVPLLAETVEHLGAGSGYYASVVCESESIVSLRLLLACQPNWGLILERLAAEDKDPWLRHGTLATDPFCPSQFASGTEADRAMSRLAAQHGFRSALIVPVTVGGPLPRRRIMRRGLLVLGSPFDGYFERDDSRGLRILVRALAAEFHESYGAMLRRERINAAAISEAELELLRMDRAGLNSKEVARRLQATPHAIDNRFYRLGVKLGVRDRHSALRIAVEFGLI
jgi:DNA-binding CsgD family transcriptional regulator